MSPSNVIIRRWVLAGCCLASALGLVFGLFVIPTVIRFASLDCAEGDAACLQRTSPVTLWPILPLLLAALSFGALCWVVVANLGIGGLLALSHIDVPGWFRLVYLVGGLGLVLMLVVDGAYLMDGAYLKWVLRPGPGVVRVVAGLGLLAFATLQLWRRSRDLSMHES